MATTLHLDTTVLLGLISDITHGAATTTTAADLHPALQRQIREEAAAPMMATLLLPLLRGKTLVTCEAARDSFARIVEWRASATEATRAGELFSEGLHGLGAVRVVRDYALRETDPEAWWAVARRLAGDPLSRAVFMTAWECGATTVTCNKAVVKRIGTVVARAGAGPEVVVVECARSLLGPPKAQSSSLDRSGQMDGSAPSNNGGNSATPVT